MYQYESRKAFQRCDGEKIVYQYETRTAFQRCEGEKIRETRVHPNTTERVKVVEWWLLIDP